MNLLVRPVNGKRSAHSYHAWMIVRTLLSFNCTYGSGIGMGRGRRIFLPPFSSNAAIAAFFSIFFLPASAPFGMKAAMTIATTAKTTKTLKYFIVVLVFGL
jgi:hypothetical protein